VEAELSDGIIVERGNKRRDVAGGLSGLLACLSLADDKLIGGGGAQRRSRRGQASGDLCR
jgi:hypothetical protein